MIKFYRLLFALRFSTFICQIPRIFSYGTGPGRCGDPSPGHGSLSNQGALSNGSYKVCIDDCSSNELSTGSTSSLYASTTYTLKISATGSPKIRGFVMKLDVDDSFSLTPTQSPNAQLFPIYNKNCPSGVDGVGHKDLNNGEDEINVTLEADDAQSASLEVIVVEQNSNGVNRWYTSTFPIEFQALPTDPPTDNPSESPSLSIIPSDLPTNFPSDTPSLSNMPTDMGPSHKPSSRPSISLMPSIPMILSTTPSEIIIISPTDDNNEHGGDDGPPPTTTTPPPPPGPPCREAKLLITIKSLFHQE